MTFRWRILAFGSLTTPRASCGRDAGAEAMSAAPQPEVHGALESLFGHRVIGGSPVRC